MTRQRHEKLPESVTRDVLARLRDGQYVCDIARSCDVSEYTVRRIAKVHQIKHVICKTGSRWGKMQKIVPVATVDAEANWRGRRTSLRWGNQWGKGFW